MSRIFRIWFVVFALIFPGIAFAQGIETLTLRLRDAGETADTQALEQILASAHRDMRAGKLTADDLRRLNTIFATTDPRMHHGIEVWLKEKPDSPYALTANAWFDWNSAVLMRGKRTVGHTWPAAMQIAMKQFQRGMDHAWRAFDSAPDYVPASDAVLRLGLYTRAPQPVEQVLARAMAEVPSRGTLTRAWPQTLPQWNGNPDDMQVWCETYADSVIDAPGFDRETCLVDAIYVSGIPGPMRSWAEDRLASSEVEFLDYAKVRQSRQDCMADVSACGPFADFVANDPSADLDSAMAFNRAIGYESVANGTYDWAPIEKIGDTQISMARDAIAHDPLNPHLISALSPTELFLPDGRIKPLEGSLTPTEHARLLRDQIAQVTPFSPDAWADYAHVLKFLPDEFRDSDANLFFQNAAVFSGHEIYILTLWQHDLESRREAQFYARQEAGATAMTPDEEAATLTCPMVRLSRLLQAICGSDDADGDCPAGATNIGPSAAAAIAEAKAENLCAAELSMPDTDLPYEETGVVWIR